MNETAKKLIENQYALFTAADRMAEQIEEEARQDARLREQARRARTVADAVWNTYAGMLLMAKALDCPVSDPETPGT